MKRLIALLIGVTFIIVTLIFTHNIYFSINDVRSVITRGWHWILNGGPLGPGNIFKNILYFIILWLIIAVLFAFFITFYITLKERYKRIAKIMNYIEHIINAVARKILRIIGLIFIEIFPGKDMKIVVVKTGNTNDKTDKYKITETTLDKANSKYIICTHKGYEQYGDYQILYKRKKEYTFWVNCVTEELFIDGYEKDTTLLQVSILALLLMNAKEPEPVSYTKMINCLTAGNSENDVQKLMGRIKSNIGHTIYNRYIKFVPKKGYMVKGNPTYCIIQEKR